MIGLLEPFWFIAVSFSIHCFSLACWNDNIDNDDNNNNNNNNNNNDNSTVVCKLVYKLVYINVRVGNEVSEWFPVRLGLRQECVMSPWLFDLYIDGVVREANTSVLGRGLELVDGNDNEW